MSPVGCCSVSLEKQIQGSKVGRGVSLHSEAQVHGTLRWEEAVGRIESRTGVHSTRSP